MELADNRLNVGDCFDICTVDLCDNVRYAKSASAYGCVLTNVRNKQTLCELYAVKLRAVFVKLDRRYSENRSALYITVAEQVFHNRLCFIYSKREADTLERVCNDLGVYYADNVSVHIEKSAARVTAVDSGIGLDKAQIIALGEAYAVKTRNDTLCHCVCEHNIAGYAGVADCAYFLTYFKTVAVADFRRNELFAAVDFDYRNVGRCIRADNGRFIFVSFGVVLVVVHFDDKLCGFVNNVSVCEDIAVLCEHDSASVACIDRLVALLGVSAVISVAEEVVIIAAVIARVLVHVHLDKHDRIVYRFVKLACGVCAVRTCRNNA